MSKINVLIPMAGKAQRFKNAGVTTPKQLLFGRDKHLIDWSMSAINLKDCNLIFIVRDEHISNYSMDVILKQKFGDDIKIVRTYGDTEGSVCSCLLAEEYINNDNPLVVYCLDVYFENQFKPYNVSEDCDGLILTFKSNSPLYSYVLTDGDLVEPRVIKTAEKSVISNDAAVGVYYFKRGCDFVYYAKEMIMKNLRTNNEFYISPLYNLFIENGKKIIKYEVDKMYVFGTPEELKFFNKVVLNEFGSGKIALCCDHSGFELKEATKQILKDRHIPFIDFGTYVNKSCDQVDYTKMACESINSGICNYGLGFCRTGQSINIAANKFKGIRSALIYNPYSAEYAIRHNGANFFSFASKFIDIDNQLPKIVAILQANTFDGGRHQVRVQKIEELDDKKI